MVEPVHSSAYLGKDKGRWSPATWSDVVNAAAGGLLDESHWIDLKRELATGKPTINRDLAQDMASLAVDGGLLIIGIEDHNSHAGAVCGVELTGLADRVDQIARAKVRPPLLVRSVEIVDPDHEGRGCLLVHIPPSAQAPHMVDYTYFGRGDRGNTRLCDDQVRSVLAERTRGRTNILDDLRQMAGDDPVPEGDRKNGHVYLLARPETAPADVLVDFLERVDVGQVVNQMLQQIRITRGGSIDPDLAGLNFLASRAEGKAFTNTPTGRDPYEHDMIDLVLHESGEIRLTCGAGVVSHKPNTFPEREPVPVVFTDRVLGMAQSFAAFAGQIGDQHAAYQGQWQFGIRMDRLRGSLPWSIARNPMNLPGHPYNREHYERVTTASTDQLLDTPEAVANQIVAPLLRGLAVTAQLHS